MGAGESDGRAGTWGQSAGAFLSTSTSHFLLTTWFARHRKPSLSFTHTQRVITLTSWADSSHELTGTTLAHLGVDAQMGGARERMWQASQIVYFAHLGIRCRPDVYVLWPSHCADRAPSTPIDRFSATRRTKKTGGRGAWEQESRMDERAEHQEGRWRYIYR
ncbi:unnamed protein product [Mycena citricolor]|nr:unnamed protein product [Mycena citricolor]